MLFRSSLGGSSLVKLARKHWLSISVVVASLAVLAALPSLLPVGRDQRVGTSPLVELSELDETGWDHAEQLIRNLARASDDLEQRAEPIWDPEFTTIPLTSQD